MLIDPKNTSPSLSMPLLTHEEFQALLHGIFPLSVLPLHSNQSEPNFLNFDQEHADNPVEMTLEVPSATSDSAGFL